MSIDLCLYGFKLAKLRNHLKLPGPRKRKRFLSVVHESVPSGDYSVINDEFFDEIERTLEKLKAVQCVGLAEEVADALRRIQKKTLDVWCTWS